MNSIFFCISYADPFIGNATAEFLQARGEQVVLLDDLARGHRVAVGSEVHFYRGNVGDRLLLVTSLGSTNSNPAFTSLL